MSKKKTKEVDLLALSEEPCPRCFALAKDGRIRTETVQRLPLNEAARPLARDGSGKCCYDCASADALMSHSSGMDFYMARTVVGNDRQDQYRLPGFPSGTVQMGITKPSRDGDLADQHAWLDVNDWFGFENED